MPGGSWHERPHWWPEGEAWPPREPEWRARRRRVARLILGCFGIAVLLFIGLGILGGLFGWWQHEGGPGPAVPTGRPGAGAWFIGPLLFIGVLLLIGFFLGGRGLRRVAQPIGDLIEGLGRVAAGDHAARVRETGPREVRELAVAFNTMAARLGDAEAQRRRLLADVTHELRTPLAAVQAQLEGVIDGVYPADREHLEPLLDQTRVLSRLIEDLRVLSLAESGALTLHRETTDLGQLVEDTAAAFRAQAASAGVTLAVDAATQLPEMEIDSVRIQEVVSNLLANALRYTPGGGRIDVTVTREGGAQQVEIRDTGAGIAPDALAHVLDRFWKSGDSRGSGLGLAIAKGLVAAHGGEISVTSEGPGRGTTVRFSLPARP